MVPSLISYNAIGASTVSRVIDQSEVFEIVGAPEWQIRDGTGVLHDIDMRLLKDGVPFSGNAYVTMIGTVRLGSDTNTFIPTRLSMISKPRQR